MKQGLRLFESVVLNPPPEAATPKLLVSLEPWPRAFFSNLRDLLGLRRRPPLDLSSAPATFWDDVFVVSRLPWGRFLESAIFHTAVIAVLWSSSRLWPERPHLVEPAVFHSSDVVYYEAPEYLPPLDTGTPHESAPAKSDPVYAAQPILSVPPEPDNHRQTIVTPPKLKLNQDLPLPNVVAWDRTPPTVPIAATSRATSAVKMPALPVPVAAPPEVGRNRLDISPAMAVSVIAPAPELNATGAQRDLSLPQPSVVEPPPSLETASTRRVGDINIGHAQVVAPAPQLPIGEQHTLATRSAATLGNPGASVVPPPPSMEGATTGVAGKTGGQMIALNLHPAAPTGPVDPPNGNRRGSFAATPQGKPGASGTPASSGNSAGTGAGSFSNAARNAGLPSGLFVGAASKPGATSPVAGSGGAAADPPLVASASLPRTTANSRTPAAEISPDIQSEEERRVFAGRKSYSMTLSVPNLNSSGGSWVMHFSEMSVAESKGDLLAPVATRAVDPGYPLELMRQNVKGVVTLSAVIHSDGHVGDVKVLNGVDDRLDQYACNALLHWQFLPALKNGSPVALQAVVMIPFRPMRRAAGF